MIRATDDVEKVRLFIGQGLLLAVQAVVLLTGALILLLLTNFWLTMVVLPILPLAWGCLWSLAPLLSRSSSRSNKNCRRSTRSSRKTWPGSRW